MYLVATLALFRVAFLLKLSNADIISSAEFSGAISDKGCPAINLPVFLLFL